MMTITFFFSIKCLLLPWLVVYHAVYLAFFEREGSGHGLPPPSGIFIPLVRPQKPAHFIYLEGFPRFVAPDQSIDLQRWQSVPHIEP